MLGAPSWPARRFVRYRRHELADQFRPAQAQGPGLAQGDAGEPLAEMPQVRADAVHARLGGQPGGLHPLRPPHAHPAAEAPAAPVRRGQVRAASAAARDRRSAEVPRHQALRRQAQGGPGQGRGPHATRWSWRAAPMGGRTHGGGAARLRLHGRLDGHRGGRGAGDGGRPRRRPQGAADRLLRLGRRAHAGGHPVADAAHRAPPSPCARSRKRACPTSSC